MFDQSRSRSDVARLDCARDGGDADDGRSAATHFTVAGGGRQLQLLFPLNGLLLIRVLRHAFLSVMHKDPPDMYLLMIFPGAQHSTTCSPLLREMCVRKSDGNGGWNIQFAVQNMFERQDKRLNRTSSRRAAAAASAAAAAARLRSRSDGESMSKRCPADKTRVMIPSLLTGECGKTVISRRGPCRA